MTARDEAGEREAFDSWWSQEGQYLDADYTEKTFAWKAWLARASLPATPGEALREALTRARAANERDRSAVAKARSGVMEQISRYSWVGEGRGPYEWDDDEYRKEFGHAMDAIEKALEPLKKIGSDLTDCPETYEEAIDARSRMPAPGAASGEACAWGIASVHGEVVWSSRSRRIAEIEVAARNEPCDEPCANARNQPYTVVPLGRLDAHPAPSKSAVERAREAFTVAALASSAIRARLATSDAHLVDLADIENAEDAVDAAYDALLAAEAAERGENEGRKA